MYIQSVTGEHLTEAVYKSQTDGKMEMSHHHFVQRLLLSYAREQLAKPQQNCSKQEEKR